MRKPVKMRLWAYIIKQAVEGHAEWVHSLKKSFFNVIATAAVNRRCEMRGTGVGRRLHAHWKGVAFMEHDFSMNGVISMSERITLFPRCYSQMNYWLALTYSSFSHCTSHRRAVWLIIRNSWFPPCLPERQFPCGEKNMISSILKPYNLYIFFLKKRKIFYLSLRFLSRLLIHRRNTSVLVYKCVSLIQLCWYSEEWPWDDI